MPARLADAAITLPGLLAAELAEAEAALARVDALSREHLGDLPPSLGPLSAVLLRSESASSSQIEHLTVGAKQLALAQIDMATSANADLVMNNVRAMEAALAEDAAPSLANTLACHAALLAGINLGDGEEPGRLRNCLVWVGSSSLSPVGAAHVAPQAELVPGAMTDLYAFLARADLPLIAQVAIAHAQFETIHPFVDGNGRTGRALIHTVLRHAGLLNVTAPISAGFLRDTERYFAALEAFRSGDATPIVECFIAASLFAATWGEGLARDLAAIVRSLEERASGLRSHSAARRLIPLLVSYPALTSAAAAELLDVDQSVALRGLQSLAERGILAEVSGKKRSRVWQQGEILALLQESAEALRRG